MDQELRPRRLRSVDEAAKQLGVGKVTLFKLLRTGELRSVQIGTRRLIPDDAIDEYIAELERQAASGRSATPDRPGGPSRGTRSGDAQPCTSAQALAMADEGGGTAA